MKSFSPAGAATKAFYGLGARTFGNPDGAQRGGGAYSAGGANANGPNQGGGASSSVLSVLISQDYLFTDPDGNGVHLTTLMTPAQQTAYAAGQYTTVNLAAGGNPARGYWVVTGSGGGPVAGNATNGLIIDVLPPGLVTLNIDATRLRFYGGGGVGGNSVGGGGGSAIAIFAAAGSINFNITLQAGANIGRLYGAGGGGGGPNGGGGAAGWARGVAFSGASGSPGGVYDAANGGASNVNVPGGAPGAGGGAGAAMGLAGTTTGFAGGAAGFALRRFGIAGVTTVIGSDPLYVRGVVQ